LFAHLEHVISPNCILASNTSSLSIAALGSGAKISGRVVGMHFQSGAVDAAGRGGERARDRCIGR
jgi:3-hydroxyacyl-CoA dehydrogenase